jgi:hypothetical protein
MVTPAMWADMVVHTSNLVLRKGAPPGAQNSGCLALLCVAVAVLCPTMRARLEGRRAPEPDPDADDTDDEEDPWEQVWHWVQAVALANSAVDADGGGEFAALFTPVLDRVIPVFRALVADPRVWAAAPDLAVTLAPVPDHLLCAVPSPDAPPPDPLG